MTWAKLDDQMARHPKVVRVGPLAAHLNVCAILYSAEHLTDGFIPGGVVPVLASFEGICERHPGPDPSGVLCEVDPRALAERLVSAGLWERDPAGYRIHDFLEYNPSRDEVRTGRSQRADGGRRRARSAARNGQGRYVGGSPAGPASAGPSDPVPAPAGAPGAPHPPHGEPLAEQSSGASGPSVPAGQSPEGSHPGGGPGPPGDPPGGGPGSVQPVPVPGPVVERPLDNDNDGGGVGGVATQDHLDGELAEASVDRDLATIVGDDSAHLLRRLCERRSWQLVVETSAVELADMRARFGGALAVALQQAVDDPSVIRRPIGWLRVVVPEVAGQLQASRGQVG